MSGNPKAKEKTVNAKAFHYLQQAETKYRSIFENAAEGMFQKENKAGDLFPRNKGGTNISQNSGYRLIYLRSSLRHVFGSEGLGSRMACMRTRRLKHSAARLKVGKACRPVP
jgi:hypothetical protein